MSNENKMREAFAEAFRETGVVTWRQAYQLAEIAATLAAQPARGITVERMQKWADVLEQIDNFSACAGDRAQDIAADLRAAIAEQDEPSQDAKDAARYRWLRYADLDALAATHWGKGGQVPTGEEFDSAIDAAMAAEGDKRG